MIAALGLYHQIFNEIVQRANLNQDTFEWTSGPHVIYPADKYYAKLRPHQQPYILMSLIIDEYNVEYKHYAIPNCKDGMPTAYTYEETVALANPRFFDIAVEQVQKAVKEFDEFKASISPRT